ncbi:MAG: hypothetical protein CVV39_08625 [Planctomycetes bacterium HGW-Planctomycetes-1]|nr:MAG: hypothetical protein CVV39_08625 [Planctomycetes bacterium HGW-Planctomycetes-1]
MRGQRRKKIPHSCPPHTDKRNAGKGKRELKKIAMFNLPDYHPACMDYTIKNKLFPAVSRKQPILAR